uniref:Uncharacterized protein n=1 Tax=Anguilla anguilla TaxID=7936 RepID=A0A0E9RFS1_ANGAN
MLVSDSQLANYPDEPVSNSVSQHKCTRYTGCS